MAADHSVNVKSVVVLSENAQFLVDHATISVLPWLVGVLADNLLQGVITVQLLHYFSYHRDSPRTDVFVFLLGLLSFAKSGQCAAIIWEQNVTHLMNPDKLLGMVRHNYLVLLTPLTTAMLGYFVQVFFLIRYWQLSKNAWMTGFISWWLLASLIFGTVVTTRLLGENKSYLFQFSLAHWSSVAVVDLCLGISLGSHIWRTRTEFPGRMFGRFVRIALATGLPCSLAAIVTVAVFAALPRHSMVWLISNLSLAKLYVISCLYTLNCRNELHEEYRWKYEVTDLDLEGIRIKTVDRGHTLGSLAGTGTRVEDSYSTTPLGKPAPASLRRDRVGLQLQPTEAEDEGNMLTPTHHAADIMERHRDVLSTIEPDVVEIQIADERNRTSLVGLGVV